jgi:hypothetical protein
MSSDLKQGANLAGQILASGQVQSGITLTFNGSPSGGTFTVSVTAGGSTQPTASQTYSAAYAAATLQAAVQALSNVGAGNLHVSGSNGGPFTITAPTGFVASAVTVSAALTGGSSPTATIAGVPATIYTVPTAASSATVVKTAVLTSVALAAVTVTGYVIPKGSNLDSTRICGLSGYSLAAGDATHWSEVVGAILDSTSSPAQGASLAVTLGGGAINAVNYTLTGAVNS